MDSFQKGTEDNGMMYEEILNECAYKQESELTEDEREIWTWERAICQESFLHFLKWMRIIEAPILGQTQGEIIPFATPPHILKLIKALLTKLLISVLKARQIYISTTLAAYHYWRAIGGVGANLLLFSKGQPEAKELLAKSHRMYDLAPNFLKFKIDPDSTEEMGFPVMRSAIKAFPSTQTAGISYTASSITADEHAAHPYADENFTSAKPTIDAGRQFISVFTADPYSNDNLATRIFEDALAGENDFIPLFFPYDVVPGRDAEWYERTKRNIPERDLARLSPDLYMAKNYPSSIEEALSLAKSIAVFDKKVLNAMREDVRGQINEGDDWELDNSICHIYKDYHIGNCYIAASDVSLGLGQDFNVTGIMDVKTGDIVADILSQTLKPEELALHSVALLKRYHNPLWWPEANLWGRTMIKKAIELGYRKFGYRGKSIKWTNISDEDLKRVGFFTDDTHRMDLFGALIPAINDFQLKIYNEVGLSQFYGMIRNANKNGKIEAMSSKHDDYVIMVGICQLKRDDVRTTTQNKTIETLTFGREQSMLEKMLEGAIRS